jgi:adenylate cyclase
LVRKFDTALAAYRIPLDPPYFFKVNEAACLAHLGKLDEAGLMLRELPDTFDTVIYARNCAKVCALIEDAELWLEGFRKAGVSV